MNAFKTNDSKQKQEAQYPGQSEGMLCQALGGEVPMIVQQNQVSMSTADKNWQEDKNTEPREHSCEEITSGLANSGCNLEMPKSEYISALVTS